MQIELERKNYIDSLIRKSGATSKSDLKSLNEELNTWSFIKVVSVGEEFISEKNGDSYRKIEFIDLQNGKINWIHIFRNTKYTFDRLGALKINTITEGEVKSIKITNEILEELKNLDLSIERYFSNLEQKGLSFIPKEIDFVIEGNEILHSLRQQKYKIGKFCFYHDEE